MEKKQSDGMISGLKILRWLFLILLIFVFSFLILFVIGVHGMQSALISEIIQYIDAGEFSKIGSIDRKGIAINHHLLFYSFIISVCCLTMIIIFLSVSLLNAKRKWQLINNRALPDEAEDHGAEVQF